MTPSYADTLRDGLWSRNPGLVQLLGLCPLLAVSTTLVSGLSLGLATLLVLTLSSAAVSAVRGFVRPEIRIPIYVTVIAVLVTAVEMALQAWLQGLYQVLGIFVPIIATNCIVIARAETFAARHPVLPAAVDGFAMGAGFALALAALGALRELVAYGTLARDLHLLLGESWRGVQVTVLPGYRGLLLAALPPGAFFGLAVLIAAKNLVRAPSPDPLPQGEGEKTA